MTPSEMISGHSHSFDTGIAQYLGVNAAIIYNHIVYWIKYNASKKDYETIDGKYWMYETQKQMSDFLEYMTVEEVKKSVVKLLDCGLLIKGNFNKNPFDRTNWYTVHDQSIIKKTITKAPNGAMHNSERSNPELATAPCYIQNKQPLDKQEEQQQAAESAAALSNMQNQQQSPEVSSAKEPDLPQQETKPKIYDCLVPLEMSEIEKIQTTKRHEEKKVLNGVTIALSKEKPPRNLAAFINFMAANSIEPPKPIEDAIEENKKLAGALERKFQNPEGVLLEVLSQSVEFVFITSQKESIIIEYSEPGFKERVESYLKEFGFKKRKV